MAYKINIENKTLNNTNYRKILHTTQQMQLVVMSLKVGEDIPKEKHPHTTQFIRIEGGKALAVVEGKRYSLKDNDSIIIPAGTWHYIKNIGRTDLKLYTLYAKPEHKDGLTQKRQPK